MTCFENIVRIRRSIYPNFFFARLVVEMIVLPQSIVSLVEPFVFIVLRGTTFSSDIV